MFWAIVGALFFFFIVLPLLIVMVVQPWFWKVLWKAVKASAVVCFLLSLVGALGSLVFKHSDQGEQLGAFLWLLFGIGTMVYYRKRKRELFPFPTRTVDNASRLSHRVL